MGHKQQWWAQDVVPGDCDHYENPSPFPNVVSFWAEECRMAVMMAAHVISARKCLVELQYICMQVLPYQQWSVRNRS